MGKYESKNKKNGKRNRNSGTQRGRRNVSRNNNIQEKNMAGDSEQLDSTGRHNDPNWYFTDSVLAEQASSFAFDSYMGVKALMRIQGQDDKSDPANQLPGYYTAPSIMAIKLNPCPGDTSTIQTGINMAALKMYTQLSNQNSKTTQYAPQDLTMLLLAVGEAISLVEHIRRAFGFAFTYNQRNRELPRRVLEFMGFDVDDFMSNLAQHRIDFNAKITAINKLPVLSNIAYLHKCADLYQRVYMDGTSPMSQIVFTRPYSTWYLDEMSSEQGSMLKTVNLPRRGKWSEWISILSKQIDGLMESATLNYVYSDILNYSERKGASLLYLDIVEESYSVIPEYNRNFIMQMHNLSIMGSPLSKTDFTTFPEGYTELNNVYQDPNKNKIKYSPVFSAYEGSMLQSPIIDLDTPTASVVDRIEFTRFMATSDLVKVTDTKRNRMHVPTGLPDHYVVSLEITDAFENPQGYTLISSQQMDLSKTATALTPYFALSQFDWAPIMTCIKQSQGKPGEISLLGDLNYWTTLDEGWFRRVNDITFMALFELR